MRSDNSQDRFVKISHNFASLWNEVCAESGVDYQAFQRSIFEGCCHIPNIRQCNILDLGTGDGETLKNFVDYGCQRLVGIDLNPEMVLAAKKRFGNKVTLLEGDILQLDPTKIEQPDVIVSGATIHNIPKTKRQDVWQSLVKLDPQVIVLGDKIAEPDSLKHKQLFDRAIQAINLVIRDRHGLPEVAKEWCAHYATDETEALLFSEVEAALQNNFTVDLVGEFGMYKTTVCVNRNTKN